MLQTCDSYNETCLRINQCLPHSSIHKYLAAPHYNLTLAIHQSTSTCVNMNTMSMKNVVIEQSSIVHIAKDHCFLRAPQACCSFVLERCQCLRFQHRYGIHSCSQFGPQSRLARANDLQSLYDQELPRVWMGMSGYCRSCCKKYNVSA